MGGVGGCLDDGPPESSFATLHIELLDLLADAVVATSKPSMLPPAALRAGVSHRKSRTGKDTEALRERGLRLAWGTSSSGTPSRDGRRDHRPARLIDRFGRLLLGGYVIDRMTSGLVGGK